MSLIKLLGGYTKQEYKELKQKYENEIITKQDVENRLDNLRVENEKVLKANEALIRDNMKLKNQLAAIEQSDHVETEPAEQYYYMFKNFNDLFLTQIIDGEEYSYLCGEYISKSNSNLASVYKRIWEDLGGKTVTFNEFNEEYNKLYQNRRNEAMIDKRLRTRIENVKYMFEPLDKNEDKTKYSYNKFGELCYKYKPLKK